MELLASADAFSSLDMERRESLWHVIAEQGELPLFSEIEVEEPKVELPEMSLREHVGQNYGRTGLSLEVHPISFWREVLNAERITPCAELKVLTDGSYVRVAGIVLVRQRPDSASGVVFLTLEDETSNANIIVWPKIFEQYRKPARTAAGLIVEGSLQSKHGVIHVVVRRIIDIQETVGMLQKQSRDFH